MNVQRFGMAAVAVFVVFGIVYFGAGQLIADQYKAISQSFGLSETDTTLTWVGRVLYTLVFCYIFVQGHEDKGIGEGVRFGLLIGLLLLAINFELYSHSDIAMGNTLAAWAVDLVASIAAGATIAAIYKPADAAPAEAVPAGTE